jgi:hypothetical protein
MGRPPIGKVALTNAERQRRFRLKHRNETRNETPRNETRNETVRALEARIRDLEAQLAAKEEKSKPHPDPAVKRRATMAEKVTRNVDPNLVVKARAAAGDKTPTLTAQEMVEAAIRKYCWDADSLIKFAGGGRIGKRQRRAVLAALHPDRVQDPKQKEIHSEAFRIAHVWLKRATLLKPSRAKGYRDMTRDEVPPMPRTPEEWAAARERAREERRAAARKGAAKRAAKKTPEVDAPGS